MNKNRSIAFLTFFALLPYILGCAAMDRGLTKLEPVRTEGSAQVFKFTAFADAVYPLKSEDAERTRIQWLESRLVDNGYDPKKYEIISRVPIVENKGGLFGDVYAIFYEIRVSK